MQIVTAVITNSGDGSNGLLWFQGEITEQQANALEEKDPEYWSSGDGFQAHEYKFPDDFNFEAAGINFDNINYFLLDEGYE